jgi:hypothetical protein
MQDFTLKAYRKLLNEMANAKYAVVTFEQYLSSEHIGKIIILRHDVDRKPLQSLRAAEIENEAKIRGTYYFRVENGRFPDQVIRRVAELGHEIGYHYEDLNATGGNVEAALASFQSNLANLREISPIRTICMHGSPLSRHDNRNMWVTKSYKEFGIIGEPYLDVDFDEVMYLSDTGRRWDGDKVSIRDRVAGDRQWASGDREDKGKKREDKGHIERKSWGTVLGLPSRRIHSTMDIIQALREGSLPDKLMLTIHPQRWTDNRLLWMKELAWQNFKNLIKYFRARSMKYQKNGK